MIKAIPSINTTVRRFEGVVNKTSEKALIELENNQAGILHSIRFKVNERPIYGCACKKGLEENYVIHKLTNFCNRLKDGKILFENIIKSGLNIK